MISSSSVCYYFSAISYLKLYGLFSSLYQVFLLCFEDRTQLVTHNRVFPSECSLRRVTHLDVHPPISDVSDDEKSLSFVEDDELGRKNRRTQNSLRGPR